MDTPEDKPVPPQVATPTKEDGEEVTKQNPPPPRRNFLQEQSDELYRKYKEKHGPRN